MSTENPYYVLAYYLFTSIENPHEEIKAHRKFFAERDVTARVYISEEGINGQLCAARADAEAYMAWMHQHSPFETVEFKIHTHHEHVFPRLTVKYRRQLVALDTTVDLSQRGTYLSPAEWRARLEKNDDFLLLDVRNNYEWEVGHFENAIAPPCDTFREFDAYAQELSHQVDAENKPVLMCCTGGIRCELYSALLHRYGFKNVYQLQGGIINYGLKEGSAHWLGKLFVFDDRLTVPISEEEAPVIGRCRNCNEPNESYYNCANMDCNELYLCCPSCVKELSGCCSSTCQQAPRRRPYEQQNAHKPFRRWHHYFQDKPTTAAVVEKSSQIL
jgi:UPF0176 protein